MWILMNDAMFSIVRKPETPAGKLHVRARRRGDINRVFGARVKVIETPGGDYRYRADIPADHVAEIVSLRLFTIDYDNFKDSTHDKDLKGAYSRVWGILGDLQPGGPYNMSGGWGAGGHASRAGYTRSLFPMPEDYAAHGRGKKNRRGKRTGLWAHEDRDCDDCGEPSDTTHRGRNLCNRCATFYGVPGVDMDDFDPAGGRV